MSDREKRDIQPIADGQITKGRQSIFKIIFDEVVVKNVEEIKTNFIEEVIVPTTLDWLYGVASSLVNDMFKSPSRGSLLPSSYRSKSSYSGYYDYSERRDRKRDRRDYDDRNRSTNSYEDISFDSRQAAEKVITQLQLDIEQYKMVTISDLCDYADVSDSWADRNYGWTNLDKAKTFRARDGRFYLDLPKPTPIDND